MSSQVVTSFFCFKKVNNNSTNRKLKKLTEWSVSVIKERNMVGTFFRPSKKTLNIEL